MLNIAGEMFLKDKKELEESNETLKNYETCIGDYNKTDLLNTNLESNMKRKTNSEEKSIK